MQQRRQFLRMSLGLGALGAGLASQAAYLGAWQAAQIGVPQGVPQGASSSTLTRLQDRLIWREKIIQGFGTTLWLRAAHTRESRLQLALSDAVQALREVEHLMSLFDAQSLLQRLNREGVVSAVPPDFYRVLALSQHISERSQGAFDVSMQPLWRLWADWAQQQNMGQAQAEAASQITPLAALGAHQRSAQLSAGFLADLTKARAHVNWRGLQLSPQRVQLQPGMALSLNGIAQGYASDKVKAVLQSHGIAHALLDTGETTMLGDSPQGAWHLAVESAVTNSASSMPAPVLLADGRAVATSSQVHTSFSADQRFHHILNPHTGFSPTHWASVTVLAPSCALADGLTKVFFMLAPGQVMPAAKAWGVDVLLQSKKGQWIHSPGLRLLA